MKTAALLSFALMLQNCEQINSQLLPKVQTYFPKATIRGCAPDLIHIETHVGNVSEAFAHKVLAMFAEELYKQSQLELGAMKSQYPWVVLGFDEFNLYWQIGSRQAHSNPEALITWWEESRQWGARSNCNIPGYRQLAIKPDTSAPKVEIDGDTRND